MRYDKPKDNSDVGFIAFMCVAFIGILFGACAVIGMF